ncbi:unnamed protein product [Rotaria socialis]|uniref:Uncharacterized protein n=1 Tax=Rotaria socialis TaxID=392032 RepID=A0A818ND34_9BILA|nr:unnamed protein product [Rotaria socialis]CAF4275069.1 unnamed protein product [Rotaria socialis]
MNFDKSCPVPIPPLLNDPEIELYTDEPVFDPDIHLSMTEPDFIVLRDGFQHVPKAPQLCQPVATNGDSQLAYTGPFRLLSDEGYRVLRMILEREMAHRQCDDRHPAMIRLSGYRSKWIQDFNRCPRILEHLSNLTGDIRLLPTTLQSSYSHVNIGYAGGPNIDSYHCDSVPYVLILLACDMANTVGGELQLIERDPKDALNLIEQYKGQVPNEYIRTIDYLGQNSCVFMQGSRIVHRVKGIHSCTEPRITVVNSYMSTNPFAAESTRYDTFRHEKPAALEYTLHKTWRANAKILDLAVGGHGWPTNDQVIERLSMAIDELSQCRDILTNTTSDKIGYYDEKKQKMAYYDTPAVALKDTEN